MDRRRFTKNVFGFALSSFCVSKASAHDNGNSHPHPHVSSHTPSHIVFSGGGIEHSFLINSTTSFAGMRACEVIIQHGHFLNLPNLTHLSSVTEYVPFYVNRENPVENLSSEQLGSIYSGSVSNWNELGGQDTPIFLASRGGPTYVGALARMIGSNFLDGAETSVARVRKNLNLAERSLKSGFEVDNHNFRFASSYEAVASFTNSVSGSLASSIRTSISFGFRRLIVDGHEFGKTKYPIKVTTHLTYRTNTVCARNKSEDVFEQMLQAYEEDGLALGKFVF